MQRPPRFEAFAAPGTPDATFAQSGLHSTEEPMPFSTEVMIAAVAALIAGVIVGYVARRLVAAGAVKHAEGYAERLIAEARAKQKEIVLEGKDDALQAQRAAEEEAREKRADLQRQERLLLDRSESLDRKVEALERRETGFEERQREVESEKARLLELQQHQIAELERVSGLTAGEARQTMIQLIVDEAQAEAQHKVREIERHAADEGDERARRILTTVMQRIAADHTSEATVTVVPLPSEEMKGRIIGREGRNIRALEQATGVDLIIDDTPEAVVLSGFDPVRREVARMALTKLISDGRIHPGRIEETVAKCRAEIEVVMRQAGEQAAYDAGVPGLHPELIKLLGRLKYRTSYGQNVLNHVIETARLAGLLAAEIGANVAESKKGGLLHDIGKAVDHEVEGPHALIGGDIASRYGVNSVVCNAIAAHHQEVEQESTEATVVQIADAISASRPGARGESLDNYVKRLDDLQQIALAFPGVERCYAIQAGREIRILVRPEEMDDLASSRLARDVVKKIEEQLQYPGQIKVTVIRETRAVDYAR
jgi:ribonuclease Y